MLLIMHVGVNITNNTYFIVGWYVCLTKLKLLMNPLMHGLQIKLMLNNHLKILEIIIYYCPCFVEELIPKLN